MEPNFQGDLTDILRASSASASNNNWEFPSNSGIDHENQSSSSSSPLLVSQTETLDAFGDPFSNTRDPLLNTTSVMDPTFYGCAPPPPAAAAGCNMFSRMLQISPAAGALPKPHSPPAMSTGALQISSPRNPGGIKRRKSQAKKVVCIPAPAAANSRASGEVVPSDLWAWRKYGQKPIKGSPYPRGYYRCSSSKGCSARKQVERSRTDPNMLVITYTSEHNHPWPTQRNALAGSTRSQPSKTSNTTSKISSMNMINAATTSPNEDQKSDILTTSYNANNASTSTTSASVKEENIDHHNNSNKVIESLDDSAFSGGSNTHDEALGFGFRPVNNIMSNVVNDHDFFADLAEIEADPLNLLFTQTAFSSSTHHHHHHQNQNQHQHNDDDNNTNNNDNDKGLDPFSLFDWSEGNNNNKKQRE